MTTHRSHSSNPRGSFLLLLCFASVVLFQFQGQPRCCHCNCHAFTISHSQHALHFESRQFGLGVAINVIGPGDSRLFSIIGVGHRSSSSPSLPGNDDEDNYYSHHHQQPQRQSTKSRRRDFVVQSISTASSIMFSTGLIAMTPILVDAAFANDDTSSSSTSSTTMIIDPAIQMPAITQKVYLDIKFEKYVEPKRLIIGLFGKDMPKTVENFVKLCINPQNGVDAATGAGGDTESGASYAGSTFYRALSQNSIQGGAIGSPNNDGSTGTSAYKDGKPFLPDNYNIRHTLPGLVSAVRANTEGYIDSRFFVQTESDAGWADGRYAAFGVVLDNNEKGSSSESGGGGGMDLVRRISEVDVTRPRNSPKESVTIVGCGLL